MKKIIILLGIPGSGKGTQAQMICETNNYAHISTGDLLRAIDANPEADPQDKSDLAAMKAGNLVPDEFIYRIAFTEIKKYLDADQGVVLDGAIRNVAQAERYQAFFKEVAKEEEVIAIEVTLDDASGTERIMSRAALSGGARPDDAPEIIAERMAKQGNTMVAPIRAYYAELGILTSVDGAKDVAGVREEIKVILK